MLNKKTFGHRKASRRSAFSLIELSIVLIIIGLLISGIIGGASLIKSANLRSVMTEARGYNIASSAFFTKYNALPGDYNAVIATNPDVGNANGVIEYVNGAGNKESLIAINQLFADGSLDLSMFASGYSQTTTVGSQTTATALYGAAVKNNLPAGKAKNSGWFFDNYSVVIGTSTVTMNMVVLSGGTNAGSGITLALGGWVTPTPITTISDYTATASSGYRTVGILTPVDALSIDSKMDDGAPNNGSVRAVASKGSAYSTAAAVSDTCTSALPTSVGVVGTSSSTLNAADTYNVSKTSLNCALGFRIDTAS